MSKVRRCFVVGRTALSCRFSNTWILKFHTRFRRKSHSSTNYTLLASSTPTQCYSHHMPLSHHLALSTSSGPSVPYPHYAQSSRTYSVCYPTTSMSPSRSNLQKKHPSLAYKTLIVSRSISFCLRFLSHQIQILVGRARQRIVFPTLRSSLYSIASYFLLSTSVGSWYISGMLQRILDYQHPKAQLSSPTTDHGRHGEYWKSLTWERVKKQYGIKKKILRLMLIEWRVSVPECVA